jgi:transcription antitermination factor NusG
LSKQIEAYVPLVKTMKQWSDRKKMVELPLLNSYVFVKIDLKEKDKVAQTKGVVNFVRHCGEIAKIREQEINQIKQLVDLGYHLEASGCKKDYKEGDKVKITSGALKNIEGFVTESKEGRFIEVVLDSIDQVIKVKLPKELLMAI